jgi:hypothetical protein
MGTPLFRLYVRSCVNVLSVKSGSIHSTLSGSRWYRIPLKVSSSKSSLDTDAENQLIVKDGIEAKKKALESRRNTLAAAHVIHLKDSAELTSQADEVASER